MTNQNTTFKGKVVYYTNVNGKEQRVEKEFDNPSEYQDFVNSNNFQIPVVGGNIGMNPLDYLFQDFFTHKLENFLGNSALGHRELESGKSAVGYTNNEYDQRLVGYETDLKKLEEEKAKKEARKNYLTGLIAKLKEYKKRFDEAGFKERIKEIDEDIKNAEKDLKGLG